MSLEQLLADHTAALKENTAAVIALSASLAGRTPAKGDPEVKKTETKTPKTETKVEKTETKPVDEGGDSDFATVRALVVKLARTHRDGIVALNAKHKISKLGALLDDENDFNTVNDQAKLNAIHADLIALGGE